VRTRAVQWGPPSPIADDLTEQAATPDSTRRSVMLIAMSEQDCNVRGASILRLTR